MNYAHIVGWGKYIPPKVVTNADLSKMVDTSDEWIVTRTGIRERRVASPKESTATMGLAAAKEALDVAGILPTEVDLIIVATATPEHAFPSTASLIQDALGANRAGAFDLSAGCSGFVYALSLATQIIQGGGHQVVLVIGSETLSRIVNWQDRATCVLFGDGAGAMVVRASPSPGGVLSSLVRSDGSGGDLLIIPAGGSHMPPTAETIAQNLHFVQMNGREVFRFATRVMDRAVREVLDKAGLTLDDVDLFIPHQANLRIIQAAARSLSINEDRYFVNLDRYGNTSSASIPIAVCEAIECGRAKPGDILVMVGFGAGLTWAAATVQWGPPEPLHRRNIIDRSLGQLIYLGAAVRSRLVRILRRVEAWLFGTPSPKRVDRDDHSHKS
jgi:3-oxoacyl-[acyl-carrier-protein] synthase-3